MIITKENSIWIKPYLDSNFIISGPCSAETRDQLINTAIELKKIGVKIFRAGIWKPRTKAIGFQGIGEEGLKWMQEVKTITNLDLAIEVANAKHIELALKYDIDIFWIGARTTTNPFSVNEISDSLKGSNKTILVKNPIHLDIKLWIGALERILSSGISQIGIIHRGFSSFYSSPFRNFPHWDKVIEVKKKFPELKLLVDPSHICGNTENIIDTIKIALSLKYDGIMIESHINPKKALTDSKQQVTPSELKNILKEIKIDKFNIDKNFFFDNQIDFINKNITELIKIRNSYEKLKK
ncbi:MAG: 3-deoxy-7-phosphoheptulonate synthase [Flavobacteriales bacterium TMED288]|nr:3-deoxy-7-phosphoheptulonate synthase [Flavobacteriales bacterium]RPG52961.1 MAG: 3-deoxy-7-phosphoheptulonate synthase [Flavobacteriales bacterium TMED288]